MYWTKVSLEVELEEIWRVVPGFEASHEVSSLGRVRTIERKVPCRWGAMRRVRQRVLRFHETGDGYLGITLSFEGRQPRQPVHRVVASAFLGAAPSALHEINHKDGDKANNRVGNLEWVTRSENGLHAYANGLSVSRKGSLHGRAKLTDEQVEEMRSMAGTVTQREIGRRFGVSERHAGRIVSGERWSHVE